MYQFGYPPFPRSSTKYFFLLPEIQNALTESKRFGSSEKYMLIRI